MASISISPRFGPALEEFSKHWPLKRGTPRAKPEELKRRRQAEMFEEEFDPYAVTPEDALDAARREVKRWRLEQLTHMKANAELDPVTSWFVLAWDAFRATGVRLRRSPAAGAGSGRRSGQGHRRLAGREEGQRRSTVGQCCTGCQRARLDRRMARAAMIDAIHHAAHMARTRNLDAARELLANNHVDRDPKFFASLEAVLEVLPVSKAFSGIELEGDAAAQGSDFEVLENLRRLAFSDQRGRAEAARSLARGSRSVTLLADHPWRLKYTPEDGDLVKLFYVPALEDAVRYDRLTGYFNSGALTLAARGIEGLVRTAAICGSSSAAR